MSDLIHKILKVTLIASRHTSDPNQFPMSPSHLLPRGRGANILRTYDVSRASLHYERLDLTTQQQTSPEWNAEHQQWFQKQWDPTQNNWYWTCYNGKICRA